MSKYLIVEDNEDKLDVIKREFIELGVSYLDIDTADNVNAALNKIKTTSFNIIILDLNLPIINKQKSKSNGGLTLLHKLKRYPEKYEIPKHIIGLTSFPDLQTNQEEAFSQLDFSIQNYESNDWKQILQNKVNWDILSNKNRKKNKESKILFSVHGIRTLGHWQSKLEHSIKKQLSSYNIIKYRYNYFSALQMLLPFYRGRIINKLVKEIEQTCNEHPNSKITFICHSFGTYALAKSLEKLPISCDIEIEKIILAGSVLKSNYNWGELKSKLNINEIVNECGYNDHVLLFSHYLSYDMGMAGRSGFEGNNVLNRYYSGGHDFFNRSDDFFEKYWIPIIKEKATEHDERNFSCLRENIEILLYSKIAILLLLAIMFVSVVF